MVVVVVVVVVVSTEAIDSNATEPLTSKMNVTVMNLQVTPLIQVVPVPQPLRHNKRCGLIVSLR